MSIEQNGTASAAPMVWECNNCGFQEYYAIVLSEDDVHELGCSRCGGNEWHKAKESAADRATIKQATSAP